LPILFADDTSLLVTDNSPDILDTKLSVNLEIVDKWFKSNLLTINFLKTFSMQFMTKNTALTKASISCNTNEIVEVFHLKFLGLEIDNTLSWNIHIDSLNNKLTTVCFMIRSVRPYVFFIFGKDLSFPVSFFIIIWHHILGVGNQYQETQQKRAVRLITGYINRFSRRNLFRQLEILPLKSQYIQSHCLF
jgi:hypothetical protein